MLRIARLLAAAATAGLVTTTPACAEDKHVASSLLRAVEEAEKQLHQTFTNLSFEDFAPSPVHGPLYQALAGGRMIYFAPESEHIIFGAVYDRNGANLTAFSQDTAARKRMALMDPADALLVGPEGAPTVIEFTDPDCPYCQALERFWIARTAEGQPVRRQIYFVSGIHPDAAAKAEHILCSADPEREFKAIYAGASPSPLHKCKAGADKVAREADAVRKMGITGTPTLIVNGKLISGFQQGELQAFLDAAYAKTAKAP